MTASQVWTLARCELLLWLMCRQVRRNSRPKTNTPYKDVISRAGTNTVRHLRAYKNFTRILDGQSRIPMRL
jgi:hypothetical protein